MDIEEFGEKAKQLARELRVGICPVWQCGGELEYVEDRTNWQEPDLRCKSCGNVWLIQKYSNDEDKPTNDKLKKEVKKYATVVD